MDLDDEELEATRKLHETNRKIMSEEEILRNLYYFTTSNIKNKKLNLQDLCGFDLGYLNVETIQKSVENLLDLYNKEKEKNKKIENKIKVKLEKLKGQKVQYRLMLEQEYKELLGE